MKSHPQSLESRIKIGKSKEFDKNYNWKGDNVGYSALHKWVYKVLGKAIRCSNCRKNSAEWANVSGEYKRNKNDWEQLCRKCHMEKDGRSVNASRNAFIRWNAI